ncbi:MAG TPA: hypothetical protein VF267_06650, partial [Gammaproteobacteria bacterium]
AAAFAIDAPSYLPDEATIIALLVFGIGGHFAGSGIARRLPQRELALPAYDAVILLCQAPAIFMYGRALGARIWN